jgi:adenine-specific DNA-methyltransferase
MANQTSKKSVETFRHGEATRTNIPTAEYQSIMNAKEETPLRVAYERRNRDLDPQLVWRGKDSQDWSDLVVSAPPLYIQEKIHPKVLIDDLMRRTEETKKSEDSQPELFSDFNGLVDENARTEFYQHEGHWTNRMILGDSLQVMASLAEREGLRGKVQCIYMDPPYGIKFNSNFQWSTTSRDVKDGNPDHITREPEQVKAFRDTWRDGIHSYLTYLRDRLTVARDLLSDSGSIFVQIGDENVHRVRCLMDEVFGEENNISEIAFKKTSGTGSEYLDNVYDYVLWYARKKNQLKYRQLLCTKGDDLYTSQYTRRDLLREKETSLDPRYMPGDMSSQGTSEGGSYPFTFEKVTYELPPNTHWKASRDGLPRLEKANRLVAIGKRLRYCRYADDFAVVTFSNSWDDTVISGYADPKVYVVQTSTKVIQRCLLMTTDPGDLVLDPTCGSGTTAYVAEQWGRRWITIDTSRVALALARARIMGARYPYYLLADSREGQLKEAELKGEAPSSQPVFGNLRRGFVYERVPHITLKSIANNTEIDVIWEKYQTTLEPLRAVLNEALGKSWEEWEIPREAGTSWPVAAKEAHKKWWESRIARQKEIDASIAAKAEFEYLYDKPYDDKKKVRVAGPFTVESLSPHRVLGVGEDGEFIDTTSEAEPGYGGARDFTQMILENLKVAGVQQAHVDDKIVFTSLTPWPGDLICAEGRYIEGGSQASDDVNVKPEKRAAIFVGPEFGTVSRPDLVAAAREAGDAGFDILITCAFNYDAHSTEFSKLGRIQVLKARMNADLHMADDLRNNGKGNLFVIFGEPDVDILPAENGQLRVVVKGVDVFHPNTGEVISDGPEGIACWFIDTDYNEESFFVRHAYFLGAGDPYTSLKNSLKAEVNEDAWSSLHSDTSRPFDKPKSGRIAVKVINHLGDEVMKVFRV